MFSKAYSALGDVTPKLEELERISHQTLKDLLDCHGRAGQAFIIVSFILDLAQRLADLKAEVAVDRLNVEQNSEPRTKPEKHAISDEILRIATVWIEGYLWSCTS
ncbi:hypothetical protein TWF970_009067 [Orbilia oligospora]|uniref:Uncharacterized protein n=1 Tax=Orbilia oligospora TaxID=2813651 RepID=A0A7C8R5I7_ORBOL|nr:hypothetical protein TWF970_009067 [Orbilia oligospora]